MQFAWARIDRRYQSSPSAWSARKELTEARPLKILVQTGLSDDRRVEINMTACGAGVRRRRPWPRGAVSPLSINGRRVDVQPVRFLLKARPHVTGFCIWASCVSEAHLFGRAVRSARQSRQLCLRLDVAPHTRQDGYCHAHCHGCDYRNCHWQRVAGSSDGPADITRISGADRIGRADRGTLESRQLYSIFYPKPACQ